MTGKEILEKAIQKAIDGGWNCFGFKHYIVDETGMFVVFDNFLVDERETWKETTNITQQTKAIIFNHEFAKALWGDGNICTHCGRLYEGGEIYCHTDYCGAEDRHVEAYEYHLQQMVIVDDPIKYLGEHLDG